MTGSRNFLALLITRSITQSGFASLISRAARVSFAVSGERATMNHGSTAMQWPPTPGPG